MQFAKKFPLRWAKGHLPKDEYEAVECLSANAISDRLTDNGYDWGRCRLEVDSYGAIYRTSSGLVFGWETVLGASAYDTFEGEYIFFIAHPKANEEQAAPKNSTLRKACEKFGWEEMSDLALSLQGASKFM